MAMTIKTKRGFYEWDSEKKCIVRLRGWNINTDISLSALEIELLDNNDSELFAELIYEIETRI